MNSTPNGVVVLPIIPRRTLRIILIFGILHIVFGFITLVLGVVIVGALQSAEINNHFAAIWCSVIFIVTGILGTIIKCKPHNKPLMVAHNVFAILSIFFAIAVLIAGAFGTDYYDCEYHYLNVGYYPYYRSILFWSPYGCGSKIDRDFGQPGFICLIVIGILEMVIAIVSTIFSFRLFNCCSTANCGNDCCGNESSIQPTGNLQMYQMQPQQYGVQNSNFQPVQNYPSQIVNTPHYLNHATQGTGQPQILTNADGQQFYLQPIFTSNQITPTSPVAPKVQNPPPYL